MATTQSVKRRVTAAKKKVQNNLNARSQGGGNGMNLSDIGDKVKEILPTTRSVKSYFGSAEAVIPVAIGALIVGAAAGAAVALFAPKLKDSTLLSDLQGNVQSAAEKLGEVLQQAKSQVMGTTDSEESHTPTV